MKDKYKKRYWKRNTAIFSITIVIISLSWFLGFIVTNSLINPYLRAVLTDLYTVEAEKTYLIESEKIISYDLKSFHLSHENIKFISFVISGISVFIGICIAVVMLFYKSNDIHTVLYELDDIEKKILFTEMKGEIKK